MEKNNIFLASSRKQFNNLDILPRYDESSVDYSKYNKLPLKAVGKINGVAFAKTYLTVALLFNSENHFYYL